MHLMVLVMAAFLVPLFAMVRAAWIYGRRTRARRAIERMEAVEAAAGGLTHADWQSHWEAAGKVAQNSVQTEMLP